MKNTKFKLNQIFVLIILLAFGQGFAALDCANGTGWGDFLTQSITKGSDNYYAIDTPEKLAWVACKTTNGALQSEKFKLTKDIDLQGKLFIPIAAGKGDARFKGTLDGQGHTIKGLYIKGSEIANNLTSEVTGKSKNGAAVYAQNVGLVAILSGSGAIKNLVLEVSEIYASSSAGDEGTVGKDSPISVGTLVGWMESGKIENCVVEGSITTSGNSNRVGGLAGNVWSATITDCVSNVSISASGSETHVGGIVGALRKGKTVTLSSCVFEGDTLISTGGTVGGIVGYHEESSVNASNLYYTGDYDGTGKPLDGVDIPTNKTSDENLNSEEVVCELNRGSWIDSSQTCSGDTSNVWSEGLSSISMNGSDGYKVSFDANGGAFASGAKTFKIVAKNALITADEITIPILANKKFAGWATSPNAEDPAKQLGEADSNKTLYAVWYDYYTVTFEIDSKTHETRSVVVPKHGHVSVEGFSVPSVFYDKISDTVSVKYYFTGWGLEAKWLGVYVDPSTGDTVKIDPTPSDTLHLADIDVVQDIALYPVWTRAETYSVTFDATLHGKTYVHFVKKVSEGDTVARPNDVVTNPGYSIEEWCTDADCTEGSKYEFSSKLESNLTLYAKWKLESYAITYVMNGGKNNVANPDSFTVESDPIIFAKPTYDGNTFGGWFYDAGFTSPATGIATGSTTGNKTLYAKWTPINYTVRFHIGAIEYLSGDEVSATIVADKKPWGANWTLKGMEYAFQREGYVHNGWSLTENGPIAYAFGETYSKNEDLVLYPHWTSTANCPYLLYDFGAIKVYENCDGTKTAEIDGSSMKDVPVIAGVDVNIVEYVRTFTVGKNSTIMLPFSIDTTKISGGSFKEFAYVDESVPVARFYKDVKNGIIKANTPYLFEPKAETLVFTLGENETVTLNTKDLVVPSCEQNEYGGKWEFRGVYSYVNWPSGDKHVWGFVANSDPDPEKVGTFKRAGAGAYIKPMRAYLYNTQLEENQNQSQSYAPRPMMARPYASTETASIDNEPASGSMDVEFIDRKTEETTFIGVLKSTTREVKTIESWFDLSGRKLNAKPTVKGIYYFNGKRVMVR